MHIFYAPRITAQAAMLTPDESQHCIKVLRLGKGDRVRLIDGQGGMYDAVIALPDPRKCMLDIIGVIEHHRGRKISLHIAIAPTKNPERFEWFIEKAVEIGIDVITPILCHRSERRVLKTDRLSRIIISTMKQAMVPYLPVLHELTEYPEFMNGLTGAVHNRFIAHCDNHERRNLKDVIARGSNVIILIGPEGDFTPGEIDLAISRDFLPVSLGSNRLRTETAGIVACSVVNMIND
jgi:16S rRNA (uracil1498-N3)-methyltransferase